MKVELLVSMASPDASHNAGDEIDIDEAIAKRFIERNTAEAIVSKAAKETANRKVVGKRKAVKSSHDSA